MALDGHHDLVEFLDGDESGAILVLGLEGHESVLVVEVVQELGELGVGDVTFLERERNETWELLITKG